MTRAIALAAALLLALAATAAGAERQASLPDIEDEVMCVSCNVALNVAESPQAYRQREFIRTLVDQGLTKDQIKARLVDEYGANVLAMPEDEGIGLAALLVPIVVVLALIAAAAFLLPRWRTRDRTQAAAAPPATDAELHRLDDDLRRFDRE